MDLTSPRRIVSFSHATTEILSYLGFADEVTTLKEYCETEPPSSDRNKPEYWFTMAEGRVRSLKAGSFLDLFGGPAGPPKTIEGKGIQYPSLGSRAP